MRHLDEGTIHAWLDGALPPEDSRAVESHLSECDACAADVADARGLIAASSRILAALDDVPAGVTPDVLDHASAGMIPAREPVRAPVSPRALAGRAPGHGAHGAAGRPKRSWIPSSYARAAAAVVAVAVGTAALMRLASGGDARSARERSVVAMAEPAAAAAAASAGTSGGVTVGSGTAAGATGAAMQRAPNAPAPTGASSSESPAAGRAPAVSPPVAGAPAALHALRPRATVPASGEAGASELAKGTAAPLAAPAPKSAARDAIAPRRDVVMRANVRRLEKAIASATGAARDTPAPAPKDSTERPRLMKSETLRGPDGMTVRQTYAVRPGVTVTLDATTPAPDEPSPGTVESPSADPAADSAAERGTNTIQWTGPGGIRYALSGQLPVAELERIKGEIPW